MRVKAEEKRDGGLARQVGAVLNVFFVRLDPVDFGHVLFRIMAEDR